MAVERFDPTQYLIQALGEPVPSRPVQPVGYQPSAYTMGLFGQLNRGPDGMPLRAAPMMTMGQGNPGVPMGGGLSTMQRTPSPGLMSAPISYTPQDMPSSQAAQAGPVPVPPMRPAPAPPPSAPPPMPPQRPANPGQEFGPGSFGNVQNFNPLAYAGNAQAYADQFAGGDLSKIAARTYRNDDGTMWNDYYVR